MCERRRFTAWWRGADFAWISKRHQSNTFVTGRDAEHGAHGVVVQHADDDGPKTKRLGGKRDVLRSDADEIIQIRTKELKYIVSSRYTMYSNEVYDGYKALERYFEEITKFYRPH